MNRRRFGGAALAALWLASTVLPAHAATYRIDPKDTTANFEVRFLGLFPIRGEFRRTTGTLVYDIATRQGSIDVSIDTTTLEASTANAQASARGPDFFEVDKYPSIDFKSSRFVFEDNRLKSVEGSLTLVGKTRPVVLKVTESHCVAAVELEAGNCHAAAELRVMRSAFGMKAWSHTVGEEVTIRIVIVAKQIVEAESRKLETPIEPKVDPVPERKRADSPPSATPAPALNGVAAGSVAAGRR